MLPKEEKYRLVVTSGYMNDLKKANISYLTNNNER